MPAAFSTIAITDGVTTATLTDGTNYALSADGWAPQVPVRRISTLGGRAYTAVAEELRINIFGATMAAAFTNLVTLIGLIDQAAAWYADETADPVTITYLPQGSEQDDPLVSLILGFDGDSPPVDLPVTFNDGLMLYEISDVRLRFVRDGVWYGEEEESNVEIGSAPEIATITFASSSPIPTPVKLRIGPFLDSGDIPNYDAGFVLVANNPNRLHVLDASTMALGAFTAAADAANVPEGAGVLVYTPAGTTQANSALGSVLALSAGRRIGVVAALRNTHATTTFQVRVEIQGPSERNAASTRPYLVDASTTEQRIVSLGTVLCEDALYTGLRLYVTASAAAGTLVVDYFALVNLDDPTSRILAVGPIDATKRIPNTTTSFLVVDPRSLESRTPLVRQYGNVSPDVNYAIPDYWRGDAFLLSDGDEIAVVYCGRATGTKWTMVDPGTGAAFALFVDAIRRSAYLAPT